MPTAIVFPFDLFGSAGCAAGAQLLGDALREMVADTADEPRPTRTHAFADQLDIVDLEFDTLAQLRDWRTTGRTAAADLLAGGDFGLWLAGNHLGALPVYEALGPRDLVIQFDAHLDAYDLHDTTATLSHGNWMRHRPAGGPDVVNVGHRDLFLLPADVRACFADAHPADAFDLEAVTAALRKRAKKAARVWLDLDVDVFDPSFAPAVHQPLPLGLAPRDVWRLVDAVWSPKVVGLSVSEFDPGRDVRDATLELLGWLLERVLLRTCEG